MKEGLCGDHLILPDGRDLVTSLPASFRDPAGFMFCHDGVLYRQVNGIGSENYQLLMESGLYKKLVERGCLIRHTEVDGPVADASCAWRIIQPEPVAFISYPYEWCFSQLQDAGLLTLEIQLAALEHGMSLKDASAYNIQFHQGRPVMIDTLSFEKYVEGRPWGAYRQFCQHFLAPLALMAKRDVQLNKLLIANIDGIPLALAANLLPRASRLNIGLLMHLHLHAMTQKKYSDTSAPKHGNGTKGRPVSKAGMIGIVQSLRKVVRKLKWLPGGTEWGDYYQATNYSDDAFVEKQRLVRGFLTTANPKEVWDLGANTGVFSRIASDLNVTVISFDVDPSAVELNYRTVRDNKERRILPLLLDLTNPSPGLGWNGNERDSLFQRGPVDCLMALALIHHLAISNNLPFVKIAEFFHRLCEYLIIEFVPKKDSQVQKLLSSRADIFQEYDQNRFEAVFSKYFKIHCAEPISHSDRTLYLMQKGRL